MATMAYQPPVNSTYFINNKTEPSPPEAYLYGRSNYASPDSSTPPSAGISPTNIHSAHLNVRQLRQPRQPMYIPAALRPTDHLTRPTDIPVRVRAPDTPPPSKESSFDSAKFGAMSPAADSVASPMTGSFTSDIDALRRGLSRAASDALEEELGDVTGPPTTAHWKPDVSAADCVICHETFTWFFRRHHCRRCGDVVCDNHITKKVPLDQNARLHPGGVESKACDVCWQDWAAVKRLRHSRTGSIAESQASSQGTAVPALAIPKSGRLTDEMRVGSMARSEGMVWSTF